jgi:hypothetical protein
MWLDLQVMFVYNFLSIIIVCMLESYERSDRLIFFLLYA